jgi:cell division septum initiation protein DivIVA
MAMSPEEMQRLFSSGEELLDLVRKGKDFTQQVVQENERLRYRIVQLEQEAKEAGAAHAQQLLATLQVENERLKEKVAFLEKRFTEVQEENQDFAQRQVEILQQNEGLANLYVASYQLHSTLDPDEVLGIVKEILINLIGAEEFVVLVLDKRTGELSPVAWEGHLAGGSGQAAAWANDLVEQVVRGAQAVFALPGAPRRAGEPVACVPLSIKKAVVGVIVLFRLLGHKPDLAPLDMEILNLLAGHAATAIVSSRLYADAERKLKTIESFIELLKAR